MVDYSTTTGRIVILFAGGLLGSTPATRRYKVRPYRIKAQDIAVFCGGGLMYYARETLLDGRLLHHRSTDRDSVCGRLLGSTPATPRYKVRPYRIKAQDIAVFCGRGLMYYARETLLDGGLLHHRLMDFDSVCGTLLGLTPARRRYKVRPCRIRTQDIAVYCGGGS